MQVGLADGVDFYGMNQADKPVDSGNITISNGDYLYLFDNSSVDTPTQYNWSVNWTGVGGIDSNLTQSGKDVVFGPISTDTISQIDVTLEITNATGSYNLLQAFEVKNQSENIRAGYSYWADYAAEKMQHFQMEP